MRASRWWRCGAAPLHPPEQRAWPPPVPTHGAGHKQTKAHSLQNPGGAQSRARWTSPVHRSAAPRRAVWRQFPSSFNGKANRKWLAQESRGFSGRSPGAKARGFIGLARLKSCPVQTWARTHPSVMRLEAIAGLEFAAEYVGMGVIPAGARRAAGPAQIELRPKGKTMGVPLSSASILAPSWLPGRTKLRVRPKMTG